MDEFIDVSAAIGSGVYTLLRRGRVVFVGKSKSMIMMIGAHRRLARRPVPVWVDIPGIVFDTVKVYPCGPDRATKLANELIAFYNPHYNTKPAPQPSPIGDLIRSRLCQSATRAPHTSTV